MASKTTQLKKTMFVSPVISTFFRAVALLAKRFSGWTIDGSPPEHKKYILVAAPHTSNWDFGLLLMAAFIFRVDVHWVGKASLFPLIIRPIMVWLGGIAIDRSQANNMVDQMVGHFGRAEELVVLVTPEGTRSKVGRWKTGFYHISYQANIPIVLVYIDAKTKTLGFGSSFFPTGKANSDIKEIQDFYADKQGICPENM